MLRNGLGPQLLERGIEDPERLLTTAPSDLRGRTQLARLDMGSEGAVVVRSLRRGGLLGKLVRRLSWDPWRALAELIVSAEATARGATVLDVVAAVTRRAAFGYHHGLVTREVAEARDLLAVLREEPEGPTRWRALAAAGRSIRRLHDAGVDHVDLNVKNVLLAPDGRAIVIDLDRCRIGAGPLPWSTREGNLIRLLRSWSKLGASEPASTQPRDPLRLARAYAGDDRQLLRRLVTSGARARFCLRKLRWRLFPTRYP